ncbi:uncharacterized protein LOC134934789 [Pseudophryne corroboree]|uniref:uncharacterized protein LOC134934789 n=1 Tax=Pseudophryne corroboree TaxID=495146 RepID=UPI003081847B
MVEEGGSVTLPCNFSYPEDGDSSTKVSVYWRQGRTSPCGDFDFIYYNTEGWTHDYTGRISLVGNPQEQRTATITIQNLRKTDGPMFCCRVRIYNQRRHEMWQNRHGTIIHFKDQIFVEQTDVVPATEGEDVIIPCYVHNKSIDHIRAVTWRMGANVLCSDNGIIKTWMEDNKIEEIGRWSVVNFPEDLSLRVREVTSSDSYRYCCEVRTKLRGPIRGSARGTDLVVAASKFELELKILHLELSVETEDSVTLNCSYSVPEGRKPLWIGIYWRVGNTSDVYAYHPSKEMVHPRYRGRTELRGLADLHITGVQETDFATYYCLVVLKFCDGLNNIRSVIQYGSRTALDTNMASLDSQWTMAVASPAVLLIIIILCVTVIALWKKGVIGQKDRRVEYMNRSTAGFAPVTQRNSMSVEMTNVESTVFTGQEDPGGIVYASVNVTSQQKATANQREDYNPESGSQVLYATIRHTNDKKY